jgi:hypothetical protein
MRTFGSGLNLELLEDRITPSSTSVMQPSIVVPPMILDPLPIYSPQNLAGSGHAYFVADQPNSDAGKTFHLVGMANVAGQGEFLVTGTLHALGNVAKGEATGTLTFHNAKGSFTIELQGPMQSGFATLPQDFHYHLIHGTGAYAHLQAKGEIFLIRHADSDHDAGMIQIEFRA